MNPAAPPQSFTALLPFVAIAIVMFFRFRNVNRDRPLRLGQLWIVPGIFTVLAGLIFATSPPKGMAIAYCVGALVVGAALGWQRGRMMHISVDPETQTLRQKASLASMFFLLGLIAVRTVARIEGAAWHIDLMLVTDVLFAFAFGLIAVQRLEMYLRAKRLLEEARGA